MWAVQLQRENWQFLVYVKGMSRPEAERLTPDPRGNPDWPMGEACLVSRKWDLPVENIHEDFPVAYASFVRNPTIPANGQLSTCKRHPSIFAIASGENQQSIKILEMQGDRNIAISDEELENVRRASQLTIRECDPTSVVSTLERLAAEDNVSVLRHWMKDTAIVTTMTTLTLPYRYRAASSIPH